MLTKHSASVVSYGLAAVLAALSISAPAAAQSRTTAAQRARRATEQLALLAARAEAGDVGASAQLPGVAAERHTLMIALIDSDPGAALQAAVPDSIRAALPARVQPLVEQHTTLQGAVEVFNADYPGGSAVLHFMQVQGRRIGLRFAAEPAPLLSGDIIRSNGILLGDVFAAEGGASIQQVSTAAPYSFGEQRVLMILVTFRDKTTAPYTAAFAHDVLFGSGSVNDFDRENSQQQTWLTGDVAGWYPIPMDSTTCSESSIRTYAQQAASAAGVNLSQYNRFVYGFPLNACGWSGYGQIGGLPTHAWINGNLRVKIAAHELGHNFGLYHARALDCHPASIGTACPYIEYGDTADTMGSASASGHFNAFQKERLGWLNYGISPPILTVTGSGTFSIEPYAGPGTGAKALKILKSTDPSTGKQTWYYVEYRALVGFDSSLSSGSLWRGVVVHTGSESAANSSYFLDMTPETTYFTDAALTPGRSFTDAAAGVTITPASIGASGATVSVQIGGTAVCAPAAPSITYSPSSSLWSAPGGTVRWTAAVKNNDGAACAMTSFGVSAAVPAGWFAGLSAPQLALNPGETGSVTVDVTSTASAADGFYDVVLATTRGATVSTSTTYVVQAPQPPPAPPVVTVSTEAAGYVGGQTVKMKASVVSSGARVSGTAVTFQVQAPDGSVRTLSAQTDAAGIAAVSLKLARKAKVGTWSVRAVSSVGGVSGAGSATFIVN